MKKFFIRIFVIPFIFVFATSCDKETIALREDVSDITSLKPVSGGGCQITSYDLYDGIGNLNSVDYFSYINGLVVEVTPSYGWRFTLQYDTHKRLISSKAYIEDQEVSTITFVYEKNRVVEEIWQEPITLAIQDRVYYTYDQRGNLIRNESFYFDLYTVYTYFNNGSMASNQVFISGQPVFKAKYTYEDNYKNPYFSATGIGYSFWYSNVGFGRGLGNRWYTSEKITFYDETGNPIEYYEQDPALTTWDAAPQHYPQQANYVDRYTQLPIVNTFTYENCNSGGSAKQAITKKVAMKNPDGKVHKSVLMLPQYEVIKKLRRI